MHRHVENWLLNACDPQTPPAPPAGVPLSSAELTAALRAAKSHFVLGSVLQSAARWSVPAEAARAAAVRPFAQYHLQDVGRTLALRGLADLVVGKLIAAGISCCVLKGQDFAERLYPSPALRPFRDIDVLVPHNAYRDADGLIQALGFAAVEPERKYAANDYGQITYFATGAEKWPLELHWNVINSPAQRKQCSLAWEDLEFLPAATAIGAQLLTPESLLILAGVHACVGHRFDSLQQLCDIRQICRGAAGPVDAAKLAAACRRLRCETPIAWSLDLVARMFRCPAAGELTRSCKFSRSVVRPWALLGPQTVMRPLTAASKLRRSLARIRLKNAA
jgi:hypothetical protein